MDTSLSFKGSQKFSQSANNHKQKKQEHHQFERREGVAARGKTEKQR